MRFAALLLLATSLAEAQSPPEDLCRLSGRVVNAVTGEPLRRTSIVLMPGAGGISVSTSSNAEGQFTLTGLPPGAYRLTANRNGFVPFVYGATGPQRPGTTLSLARGQSLADLTLKLTPHAVVVGRIVDEEGEPVANVNVNLEAYRYLMGRKQLIPTGGGGSTNDLGEYRIFGVAPGRYFLGAIPARQMTFATDRSAAGGDDAYVTTYYPGVIDLAGATALQIPAGGQLRGIDMVLTKTRTYHIKGRVVHGMAGRPNVSMVQVIPRGAGFGGMRGAPVDAAGNFDIPGLAPGAYTLIANFNDATGARRARASVDVGRGNVEGLSLTALPEISVQGQVRSDPDSPPLNLASVRFTLQQRELDPMSGGTPQARPDEQGIFEIKNAAPDRYNLNVGGLPSGAYVKSARTDRDDVLASGLDLTSGAPPGVLTVVISPRGAAVSGGVQSDKTGQPAPGATVVLIPQAKDRREQPYYYRTASADQNGAFTLPGVPPGDYKLYAWQELQGDAYLDPDFMKPFESKGESITLREGDQKTVPLKLIPADN